MIQCKLLTGELGEEGSMVSLSRTTRNVARVHLLASVESSLKYSEKKGNLTEFRRLLKRFRAVRNWSQERLAAEAEVDHSLVSRIESGQRKPSREFVIKAAKGLELTPRQRDELLIMAGYCPDDLAAAIDYQPVVNLLARLNDPNVPEVKKQTALQLVGGLVSLLADD